MKPQDLTLYVITDRTWLHSATLADAVTQALEGGATCVQMREKHISTAEYIARARPDARLRRPPLRPQPSR